MTPPEPHLFEHVVRLAAWCESRTHHDVSIGFRGASQISVRARKRHFRGSGGRDVYHARADTLNEAARLVLIDLNA